MTGFLLLKFSQISFCCRRPKNLPPPTGRPANARNSHRYPSSGYGRRRPVPQNPILKPLITEPCYLYPCYCQLDFKRPMTISKIIEGKEVPVPRTVVQTIIQATLSNRRKSIITRPARTSPQNAKCKKKKLQTESHSISYFTTA